MIKNLVTAFVLLIVPCGHVEADDDRWRAAIGRVEQRAQTYERYAHSRGTTWAGAMYNEYHTREHHCSILGRMLGKMEYIRHLEFEYPDIDRQPDPHDALVASISLAHWIFSVNEILKENHSRRVYFWNLNCVGKLGIAPTSFIATLQAAKTTFERSINSLVVRGPIEKDFFDLFTAALRSHNDIKTVSLGSGGGNVLDAIRAGTLIRLLGLDTEIYDDCLSACTLVFIGGVQRSMWANSARLGFHKVTKSGTVVPADDPVYREISNYVTKMGVDAAYLVSAMHSASPDQFYYPEPTSLCERSVVTWVQRLCTSPHGLR